MIDSRTPACCRRGISSKALSRFFWPHYPIDLASSKLLDIAFGSSTGGGFGGLLGSLFALGHPEGGLIRGPGKGTSDSMVTRVSNGEFIVNAAQTSKYLDILQAINNGANLKVLAVGGHFVSAPNINQTFSPTINITGGTSQQNADMSEKMDLKLRAMFRGFYQQETAGTCVMGDYFASDDGFALLSGDDRVS